MPPLTRRFLGTAAIFLIVGVVLGLGMLVERDLFGRWPAPGMRSAHTHLILVGAIMETIIGTAWWFFPRTSKGMPAAPGWAAELAWWGLTGGTILRALAEGGGFTGWLSVIGGTAQVLGIIFAVVALRRRVRASVVIRR